MTQQLQELDDRVQVSLRRREGHYQWHQLQRACNIVTMEWWQPALAIAGHPGPCSGEALAKQPVWWRAFTTCRLECVAGQSSPSVCASRHCCHPHSLSFGVTCWH